MRIDRVELPRNQKVDRDAKVRRICENGRCCQDPVARTHDRIPIADLHLRAREIWTIEHSTHPLVKFFAWLKAFRNKVLADVRRFPDSLKVLWSNKEVLPAELDAVDIGYMYMSSLHLMWFSHQPGFKPLV